MSPSCPYAPLYLGLACLYEVRKEAIAAKLVRSADGIHWHREATREPLVADGIPPGLSANMVITPANALIIAGEREGELLSQAFRRDGSRLFLNASIREGGQILMRFCNELGQTLSGLGLNEQVPLSGSAGNLQQPAQFALGPKSVLKVSTRGPVLLHFSMRNAILFGWTLA